MKIITKEIDKLLSIEGKKIQDEMVTGVAASKLKAVCHLFHPFANIDWYLIGYSVKDDKNYIFTLTSGDFLEYGDIYLEELLKLRVRGLPIEREYVFKAIDTQELFNKLKLV